MCIYLSRKTRKQIMARGGRTVKRTGERYCNIREQRGQIIWRKGNHPEGVGVQEVWESNNWEQSIVMY